MSSSEATSAMARISSSVANGPWGSPRPGMSTLATFTSRRATGPTAVVIATMIGASRSATRSVCCTVNVLGVTSAKTNRTSVIPTVETSSAQRCTCRVTKIVASVVPPIVQSSVSSSTTFR